MSSSARNLISIKNKYDRVVLLVDMDCFYCQVEEKLNPEYAGKPLAVVQYNAWRGGGIIAVNYAARARGVTRHMRGDEAREQCPEIVLAKVPNVREKADLSKYRDAGKEVANVLQKFTGILERASVDEAYLDITEAVNKRMEQMNVGSFVLQPNELQQTFAVGYANIGEYISEITKRFADPYANDEEYQCGYDANDVPAVRKSDIRLLIGASICSEIRAAVKEVTGYECSAGIAHNKILAKLACGMNKPNKQTILPLSQIPLLFETLPVGKITGLGAKFGEDVCERLNIRFLGQLLKFTEAELQRKFDEKNGTWLYYLGRGVDLEAVTPRFYSKSIGCCKKFPGRNNITGLNTLNHWLNELACEINERLEKDITENNRRAKQMVVSFIQEFDGEEVSSSRSAPLASYDKETMAKNSLDVIKINTKQFFRTGSTSILNNPIKFLGISVGKFETINNTQNNKLQEMFANQAAKNQLKIKDEEMVTAVNTDRNLKTQETSEKKLENKKPNYLEKFLLSKKQNESSSIMGTETFPRVDEFSSTFDDNDSNEKTFDDAVKIDLANSFPQHKLDSQIVNITKIAKAANCDLNTIIEKPKSFFRNALKKSTVADEEPQNIEPTVDHEKNELFDLEADIQLIEKEASIKTVKELQTIEFNNNRDETKNSFFVKALKKQKSFESCDKTNDDTSMKAIESNFNDMHSIDEINIHSKSNKRKHSEINENITICDYQSSYVEFAIPELQPEFLQFIKCQICNTKIPSDERSIQTHQDHHLAHELSQQQRSEYRQELKTKVAPNVKTSPSVNKKTKKLSNNNAIVKNKGNITKFLTLSQPDIDLSFAPATFTPAVVVIQEQNDTFICPDCKATIKVDEIDEHKDYHVAKNLQRKLNQLDVKTVTIVKKSSSSNQRKSLSSTITNVTNKSAVAKPINEFFTQSNI